MGAAWAVGAAKGWEEPGGGAGAVCTSGVHVRETVETCGGWLES